MGHRAHHPLLDFPMFERGPQPAEPDSHYPAGSTAGRLPVRLRNHNWPAGRDNSVGTRLDSPSGCK
jgi:hypothetical protein